MALSTSAARNRPPRYSRLADGARVGQRVHPGVHVARGRLAGHRRRHQQPQLTAQHRDRATMNGELRMKSAEA
jgi:hypothetical protein